MVLLNFPHNLSIFLDIFELRLESNKKKLRKKKLCWWYGLRFVKKWPNVSHKSLWKKSALSSFLRFMSSYFFLHLFFKLILCTNTTILSNIWDHYFKTVPPELFFWNQLFMFGFFCTKNAENHVMFILYLGTTGFA